MYTETCHAEADGGVIEWLHLLQILRLAQALVAAFLGRLWAAMPHPACAVLLLPIALSIPYKHGGHFVWRMHAAPEPLDWGWSRGQNQWVNVVVATSGAASSHSAGLRGRATAHAGGAKCARARCAPEMALESPKCGFLGVF